MEQKVPYEYIERNEATRSKKTSSDAWNQMRDFKCKAGHTVETEAFEARAKLNMFRWQKPSRHAQGLVSAVGGNAQSVLAPFIRPNGKLSTAIIMPKGQMHKNGPVVSIGHDDRLLY